MTEKILIVEDEFIVANDMRIMLEKAGYKVCGIAPSVTKALEMIESKQPHWILLDIFLQGDRTGIDLARQLTEMEIPFIYISANTNETILEAAKSTLPYGFLVKPFREKDLLVMLDIAQYRHAQHLKYSRPRELSWQKQIAEIVGREELLSEKTNQIGQVLNTPIPFDFLWISRSDTLSASKDLNLQRCGECEFASLCNDQLILAMSISQREFKFWGSCTLPSDGNLIFNGYDFKKLRMENCRIKAVSDHFNLVSALLLEVGFNDEKFQFVFFSASADTYNSEHTAILKKNTASFELIVEKIIYGKDPVVLSPIELKTKTVAPDKDQREENFNGIIGNSALLFAVFNKIEMVAPDDTSVLILGESGTGKERIAHTIHKLSPRKNKPLITVNCAALPLTLIESELFGHEKGAFTGANDKRIGKFEQADGGSIFLDEIGELPLEAQAKLLRVLQEKEIERVGGNKTKKINVRIITATNRNLEKEVAEGRFRLDLYYRLNVFPIELPALRQRKEDIPVLVNYFMEKFNKSTSRTITGISAKAMETLQGYHWPGNIRELEHLIERSMLMATGTQITGIEIPTVPMSPNTLPDESGKMKTMEEMERDHIMSILKMCNGKIFGPGGAAEILNIPSTTLNSKIKKLGIRYEFTK